MSKNILTEEDVNNLVAKAVKETLRSLDGEAIDIAGCDAKCVMIYAGNSRNGKGRLSLKDYCQMIDVNHRTVYNILRDYQWVENLGQSINLTLLGFGEINAYDTKISSPVMTTINGALYVDDTHEGFTSFWDKVEKHEDYADIGSYNSGLKDRQLPFSRLEMSYAEELDIEIVDTKLLS